MTRHRLGQAWMKASTKNLTTRQWLAIRREILGSSDAAAVVGLNPYRTPMAVWNDKMGLTPIDDTDPSEASHWGHVLEPIVARDWSRQTGYKVRRINAILVHDQIPWMGCNLDFVCTTPDGPRIVEVKTTAEHNAGRFQDGVPDDHYIQIQHQLMVTQLPWAYHVLLIGGQHLISTRVDADTEVQAALSQREQEFWTRIQTQEPPLGTASVEDILTWQGVRNDDTIALEMDAAWHFKRYALWSDLAKNAETEKDTHKAALLRYLGPAKKGFWTDAEGNHWSIQVIESQRETINKKELDRIDPDWREVAVTAKKIQSVRITLPQTTRRPGDESGRLTTK